MTTGKFVAYSRVSTAQQGQSGLGLEAQSQAVADYLASVGGNLVATYTEVESGKRNNRPELAKAMHHAKVIGGTLLIAKLDRLSRDAHFLLGLKDAGIEFVACDMPHANRLTVGIMALVAEQERDAISSRTKAALAAAKARGRWISKAGKEVSRLGNPNGARALQGLGNDAAVAAVRAGADRHAAQVGPVIAAIRGEGVTSNKGIAAELNRRGILTARGGQWHATTVRNLLARTPTV